MTSRFEEFEEFTRVYQNTLDKVDYARRVAAIYRDPMDCVTDEAILLCGILRNQLAQTEIMLEFIKTLNKVLPHREESNDEQPS